MKSPGRVIAIILLTAVIVGALGFTYMRLQNPEAVVERARDCFDRRDVGCVMSLSSGAERSAMNLDDAKMKRLFDEIIEPRMKGYAPDPDIRKKEAPDGMAVGEAMYRDDKKNSYAFITLMAHNRGFKVEVEPYVSAMLLTAMGAYTGEEPNRKTYPLLRSSLKKYRPTFDELGIKGLMMAFANKPLKLYTWSELETEFARLEKEAEGSQVRPNVDPASGGGPSGG